MSAPQPVCRVADLAPGTAARFVVAGQPVAVVHTTEGFFAVSDVCSHAEVSLSQGEVLGTTLECWLHGSRFDVRTGAPSGPPAAHPVATYPVTIDGEHVAVSPTPNFERTHP